jgi:hypothetical protein
MYYFMIKKLHIVMTSTVIIKAVICMLPINNITEFRIVVEGCVGSIKCGAFLG